MFVQIPDFPMYLVDENGTVVSMKYGKWRVLKPRNGTQYLDVLLYQGTSKCNHRIHQLVARIFIGEKPEGHVVNHKDTNKHNNSASNLEYVTPSQNTKHAYDNGVCEGVRYASSTANAGEKNHFARLTDQQASQILLLNGKALPQDVATQFGISRDYVKAIWSGRRRKHLRRVSCQ